MDVIFFRFRDPPRPAREYARYLHYYDRHSSVRPSLARRPQVRATKCRPTLAIRPPTGGRAEGWQGGDEGGGQTFGARRWRRRQQSGDNVSPRRWCVPDGRDALFVACEVHFVVDRGVAVCPPESRCLRSARHRRLRRVRVLVTTWGFSKFSRKKKKLIRTFDFPPRRGLASRCYFRVRWPRSGRRRLSMQYSFTCYSSVSLWQKKKTTSFRFFFVYA